MDVILVKLLTIILEVVGAAVVRGYVNEWERARDIADAAENAKFPDE